MRKTSRIGWCLLAFIGLVSVTTSYAQSNFDFRYVCWGSSREEVKATENDKKPIMDTEDALIVEDNINDLKCNVIYIFTNNKLVRAKYFITENFTDEYRYKSSFDELENLLTEKYGKPKKITRYPDEYKRMPNMFGVGLSTGRIAFMSSWETSKTEIVLGLTGNNYKVQFEMQYKSLELKRLEESKNKKKALDKL